MATKKELNSYRDKELKTADKQQKDYETYRTAQVEKAYKTQAALIFQSRSFSATPVSATVCFKNILRR